MDNTTDLEIVPMEIYRNRRKRELVEEHPRIPSDETIRRKLIEKYPIFRELVECFPDINTPTLAYLRAEYYPTINFSVYDNFAYYYRDDIILDRDQIMALEYLISLGKQEIWLPIAITKFRENYMVSNFGRVQDRQTGHIHQPIRKHGYEIVILRDSNGIKRIRRIDQLVLPTFRNEPDYPYQIIYIDGNRANNKVWNLEYKRRKMQKNKS